MKPFLFSIILLFSTATFAAPHQPEKPQPKKAETKVEAQADVQGQESGISGETYVYVCTGSSATKYHSHSNCRGLSACKGSVEKVTISKAENNMRRTPCKICYGD
ncbi:MAG: hypothetical protein IJU33_03140 [Bacteroidales bacterium]|nr:hypothetical protein [Bacteroidales bacterium]